jgi:hypothetical protein
MIATFLIVHLVLFESLNGLSLNMAENGCNAYDCKRTCINTNSILQTPGDNGFRFEIEGLKDNKYIPDKVYKGQYVRVLACHFLHLTHSQKEDF